MIPRLDSARLMINLGFPFTTELPWIPYGQFSSLSTNANSRGADFNFSSCSKLRVYHVNLAHALFHLSMLLSPTLHLTVSGCNLLRIPVIHAFLD